MATELTPNELKVFTSELGLTVSTYSPGDGMTRYRFSTDGLDYFACRPIYTAYGLKEAVTFFRGYAAGCCP